MYRQMSRPTFLGGGVLSSLSPPTRGVFFCSRAIKNLIVAGWCFCGGISTLCYRTVPSTREPTDVRSVVRCLRCGALVRKTQIDTRWIPDTFAVVINVWSSALNLFDEDHHCSWSVTLPVYILTHIHCRLRRCIEPSRNYLREILEMTQQLPFITSSTMLWRIQ